MQRGGMRGVYCILQPRVCPAFWPTQAGAGISPLGSLAMLGAAAIDLAGPQLGIKTGPVWGAGEAGCALR